MFNQKLRTTSRKKIKNCKSCVAYKESFLWMPVLEGSFYIFSLTSWLCNTTLDLEMQNTVLTLKLDGKIGLSLLSTVALWQAMTILS